MRSGSVYFFVLFSGLISAQERSGIAGSNYYPAASIHMNASTSADSRTYMQLHLAGANAFARTNAAYLEDFSLWSYLSTRQAPIVPNEGRRRNYLYGNLAVEGPAFFISKNRFGAGLFVRARSVADIRRIPYRLTSLLMDQGFDESQAEEGSFSIRNAKVSNMSWAEYGANFSYMVHRRQFDLITLGGNLKYLTGINLVYANIRNLEGEYGPNLLRVADLQGRTRSVPPAFGAGRGWGLDLGITYKKMLGHIDSYRAHSRFSKCTYVDYKYKVALSLRDAGYISYKGNTSGTELAGSGSFYTFPGDSSVEERISGNFAVERMEGQKVTASLPGALALQYDHNFENNIFLNVTLNKSIIPNGFVGVQSSDLLSITPRFETLPLEVALPLTFHRFTEPQVGLALRVRSLVVGVDNVLPLVMKNNTYGLGVYFNLAITLFRNPACSGSLRGIADCQKYKGGSSRIKRKNTLLSPKPRKK